MAGESGSSSDHGETQEATALVRRQCGLLCSPPGQDVATHAHCGFPQRGGRVAGKSELGKDVGND